MAKCPSCAYEHEKIRSLARHYAQGHRGSAKDLYLYLFCDGVEPTCRCGCGASVRFVSVVVGYKTFARGHQSRIDAAGNPKPNKPKVARKQSQRFRCPLCSSFEGTQGRLENHIVSEHGERPSEVFVTHVLHGDVLQVLCACGCGQKTRWIDWRLGFAGGFLRGHNAAVASVFHDPNMQVQMAKQRSADYASGRLRVWNKGLTNSSDERVKKMHDLASQTLRARYKSGTLKSWQSREPEKCVIAARKSSVAKRFSFEEVKRKISSLPLRVDLLSTADEYKTRQFSRLTVRCQTCGNVWSQTLKNLEGTPRCFSCNPQESFSQIEMLTFVQSLVPGEQVVSSDRTLIAPKEVDIWVPSRNLAIELNGLTFHTETDLPRDYHHNKTTACAKRGVRLMHVFGDEWRGLKRPIVESMIMDRLGIIKERVGARSCQVGIVDNHEAGAFFELNHLDGAVRSARSFGLRDENGRILVALSVRKPRQSKYEGLLEVARFCCRVGTVVPGGLSRLIKVASHFGKERGFTGLLSYVDMRLGTGEGYERAGFSEVGQTEIRFWWTDGSQRFDRFQFRADSARGMSEREVALDAGVTRIYGCRNRIMVQKFSDPRSDSVIGYQKVSSR